MNYKADLEGVNVGEPDFGVLVGLAYAGFVHDLRLSLAADGHPELHPWIGYVLRALDSRPLNLRDLAGLLDMTSQGAIKIVDQLVADGYVARVGDQADGRMKRLEVAARGRDLLARAKAFHLAYEQSLADRYGAETVEVLRRLMGEMAASSPTDQGERAMRPI